MVARGAQVGHTPPLPTTSTTRIDCPYCGNLGSLYPERVLRGQDALTTYFCDNCNSEWDEREGEAAPKAPRKREPKTRQDKQLES
jgi:transposase-like protein